MLTAAQQLGLVQAGLVPLLAVGGAALGGWPQGVAAAYGAVVALAVTGVLVWREMQAQRHPEWDEKRLLGVFVRTSLERTVLLVLLLGLGFGPLDLRPLPLVLGLIAAQLGWLIVALGGLKKHKQISR
jgi:ATP synthase protein I